EQLALNQRVQGSSPCAPTNHFNGLDRSRKFTGRSAIIPTKWLLLFSSALERLDCADGESPTPSHGVRKWLENAVRHSAGSDRQCRPSIREQGRCVLSAIAAH